MFNITIHKHEDNTRYLKSTKHNWIWKISLNKDVEDKYMIESFRYQSCLRGNGYYVINPYDRVISNTAKTADRAKTDAETMIKKICANAKEDKAKDIEIANSKITYNVDC